MHNELITILGVTVTGWKIVGYLGVLMFTSRWFVQILASRKAQKPVVPRLFWILSMAGSLMCLSYFVFGKNDSVGILGYLFPSAVSTYNLILDSRHRANQADSMKFSK
jgi:lipid-A-disaccharide synthase-like uncharacterized protein